MGDEYTYVSKVLEERIVINSLQRLVSTELLEWLEGEEKEDWWMDGMIIKREGYDFMMIDEDNLISAEINGNLLIILVRVFLSIKDYLRISTIRQ